MSNVAIYVALKQNVFLVELAHISENTQIIVVGRTSVKDKLSLREIRKLDES